MEINVIENSKKYNYKVGLSDDKETKWFTSPNANYCFNLKTGTMYSWGNKLTDDPSRFPAPNILDIECTTICNKGCKFCYKSNNLNGKCMNINTFKKIFDVLPKSITQIAFGADYDLTSNPDLWKMMEYCRENYVIPNITAGYVDDEKADKLAKLCGAVAISIYNPKDKAYDSIKRLTDRGMTQVNIHFMIAEETYEDCLKVIDDIKTDERLSKLNALVLLSLKQKGRGIGYHILSQEKFTNLCNIAREKGISLGFDSCSSLKAFRAFSDKPEVRDNIIPCEGGLESSYINVNGFYYPCSFMENVDDTEFPWKEGINVLDCKDSEDFLDKVWFAEKTLNFKDKLECTCNDNSENCRHCPYYNV